jgi:hypothetical protein
MVFDLASILAGSGTAVLGFIGGVVQQRTTREARFEKRMDQRLVELELQVAECRKRDSEVVILRMGMRMIVPEMQRLDRGNTVLTQVANALSALPEDGEKMTDLIEKLGEIPGTNDAAEADDE